MNPIFERLTLLTGAEAAAAFEKSSVIVFGLGGVGSWCAEALVRSGVGSISLVDFDRVCASNVNRQIQAMNSTIGRLKTVALEERFKDINPLCNVKIYSEKFSKETAERFDITGADYVIDAIDTLTCKLDLIETAVSSGKHFFSSMGMGRKLNPTLIRTADIWDTHGCPLASAVRQGLRKRNFSGRFTAVYSAEKISGKDWADNGHAENSRGVIGSAVTVTATAGMILASLVMRHIIDRLQPPCEGPSGEKAL